MISRQHRFRGHQSIRYLLRRGRYLPEAPRDWLAARVLVVRRQRHWRLTVVVSKKVSKRAVVRNRIRRRLVEYCRHHLPDSANAFDMALIVSNPDLATISQDQLEVLLSPLKQRLLRDFV